MIIFKNCIIFLSDLTDLSDLLIVSNSNILVFHNRPFWCISVRLSDRSTQNKINFVQNCPKSGLNPQPPDHHSNALPTELGRNLLGIRFLKWALFVSCTTSHVGLCSFLESVGRTLERQSGGCGFKPHWGQFLMKFILFCVTLDLSDFIIWQKYVSWKTLYEHWFA